MYSRYAIYFTAEGALAAAGAAWLGWDVARGAAVEHPQAVDLDLSALTETPRKYGFHATLKPPVVLSEGKTQDGLRDALSDFCAKHTAVRLDGLEVRLMGRFFALVPVGDVSALKELAAAIVTGFDAFRAAPSQEELARRRAAGLTAAQEENLVLWGYPYVLDQFRFHMTLSGRVKNGDELADPIRAHFAPVLRAPFLLDHLTLAGQRTADGMFEEILRMPLRG